MEIWKDIDGFEGLYEVSDLGRVRRMGVPDSVGRNRKERLIAQTKDGCGYYRVRINKNATKYTRKVHRLVATAFIPNPENKPEVNHKKGIKTDNRVSELVWSTTSENVQHAYDNLGKVTPMKGKFGASCPNSKKIICTTLGFEASSVTEMAKILGIGLSSIASVAKGMYPHTHGLNFRYI